MRPYDLSPAYAVNIDALRRRKNDPSLWQNELTDLLTRSKSPCGTIDEMLELIQRTARLAHIYTAGLENNSAFRQEITKLSPPLWSQFGAPPAADDLQDNLADKLYNIDPAKAKAGQEHAFINLGNGARRIGPRLIEKCMADGAPFSVDFAEPNFSGPLLNHSDEAGVKALAKAFVDMTAAVTKRMVARPGLPTEKAVTPDKDKSQLYSREIEPYAERSRSGDLFFTLTVIPTERDAQIDQMNYKDYIKLFFEMCDQPWDAIDTAQQALIRQLDAGKSLRFTNNDGTDVSMDIDGFTFCNSLIAKNVPGSEVFSAPRRDSVEGKIVAKGRFSPPQDRGEIIENLTLEFNKGRLVSYKADKGLEAFERMIGTDEGARYIGEVGIGTNPHLKQHVCNGLLVEKIGGSFHLALGGCYTMKEYQGAPVNVDNGNHSAVHWDLTTMLHGKEGRIYLDGKLLMDDGKFLDPQLDVLNRGWEALPEAQRPAYWRDYYRNKPGPNPAP